jgi:hypothetical protein
MMSLHRISLVMALALSAAVSTSALAREDLPAVNDEGMELVKDSDLTTVYADPDADLSIYNRILLKDATVAFR